MKTNFSYQSGCIRPEMVAPVEVEYHAARSGWAMLQIPVAIRAREGAIKDLLAKIERKLPNVAEASEELAALRSLLQLQLADATALQGTFGRR